MIIDILIALFSGVMITLLPMLLLQTLEGETLAKRWRVVAWIVLAAFSWCLALFLSFGTPWAGLVGALVGGLIWWRLSRKPKIVSQVIEDTPESS